MRERLLFLSRRSGGCLVVAALLVGAVAVAANAQPPAVAEPDPGVRPTRLIDRDEIRVSRIDLQPGAVRSSHAHDDVEYHVWAPVSGTLEITIGAAAPVRAAPGQAMFMTRGTRHGFRNVGDSPAAVFEIFVKSSTAGAGGGTEWRELLAAWRRGPASSAGVAGGR